MTREELLAELEALAKLTEEEERHRSVAAVLCTLIGAIYESETERLARSLGCYNLEALERIACKTAKWN